MFHIIARGLGCVQQLIQRPQAQILVKWILFTWTNFSWNREWISGDLFYTTRQIRHKLFTKCGTINTNLWKWKEKHFDWSGLVRWLMIIKTSKFSFWQLSINTFLIWFFLLFIKAKRSQYYFVFHTISMPSELRWSSVRVKCKLKAR